MKADKISCGGVKGVVVVVVFPTNFRFAAINMH